MTLNTLTDPHCLYLAIGKYVNVDRPWFTGDIIEDIEIPGVGQSLAAIIIAHPCSMRGKAGDLEEKILVSSVKGHEKLSKQQWSDGYYGIMPLPDLPIQGAYHVAHFNQVAPAETSQFLKPKRVACLSHYGINLLQRRLIFYLTRSVVQNGVLQKAFYHTYFEADLLEEWETQLRDICENPKAKFEEWIGGGDPSRQKRLEDEKERSLVRAEMREEIKRLKEEASTNHDKTQ